MRMLALFTALPQFCPQCGEAQVWSSAYAVSDYHRGCSFDCRARCGLSYAYVPEEGLLAAATEHGSDLARMLRLSR
jgi:hypothetical protein